MAQNDQALLTRLRDHGLEFVVIGGVCVVYHGVPMATFDLDICCRFKKHRDGVCHVEHRGQLVGTWTLAEERPHEVNFAGRRRKDFKTKLPFTGAKLLPSPASGLRLSSPILFWPNQLVRAL